eukprot:CAMPEP_0174946352 /NCGR_PEP_ID=MMETSP1355-20121228/83911_1 /TAXON_ID=464990 /ORGANISM="Hemiselmis tepida, Strain CCMP443" /LENGTH=68 /DNA_ID=CAMNT_0016193777 /DNA_START=301 /DNA_END=504 /DNA_ORIENTATION=+
MSLDPGTIELAAIFSTPDSFFPGGEPTAFLAGIFITWAAIRLHDYWELRQISEEIDQASSDPDTEAFI